MAAVTFLRFLCLLSSSGFNGVILRTFNKQLLFNRAYSLHKALANQRNVTITHNPDAQSSGEGFVVLWDAFKTYQYIHPAFRVY